MQDVRLNYSEDLSAMGSLPKSEKGRFSRLRKAGTGRERKFVFRNTCPSMSDRCQGPLTAANLPPTWRGPTDS
jgi:hypothetical protein